MGVITKIIETNSNEKTFIKNFIHTVTAADSRITCNKTDDEIDQQFSGSSAPTFTFNADGVFTITFTRLSAPSQPANRYSVTMRSLGTDNASVSYEIYFTYNTTPASQSIIRTFNLRIVSGQNTIVFILANYDNNMAVGPGYFIQGMSFRDGSNTGFSASNNNVSGNAVMGKHFYFNGEYVLTANRLPYSCSTPDSNRLELITSKVFIYSSQAVRHSSTAALFDCSTLPSSGTELSIGGSRYYSLNANTLIPLT